MTQFVESSNYSITKYNCGYSIYRTKVGNREWNHMRTERMDGLYGEARTKATLATLQQNLASQSTHVERVHKNDPRHVDPHVLETVKEAHVER